MATKTLKNGDVRQFWMTLMMVWETSKKEIKLSGASLYRLLAIKKKIEEQAVVVNDAFVQIGISLGGVDAGNGQMRIPDEHIEEANKLLSEVAMEEMQIEYSPIELHESDYLPPDLMELFFDFIQI